MNLLTNKKITKAVMSVLLATTLMGPALSVGADDKSDLASVNAQSVTVAQKLASLNDTINATNKQVNDLQADIDQRQSQLNVEARNAQVNPQTTNVVNVLLSAKSLSDLIQKATAMTTIVQANSEVLNKQEEQEVKLQKTLAQNQTAVNEALALQEALASKKITLETKITAEEQAAAEKAAAVQALQTAVQAATAKAKASAAASSSSAASAPKSSVPKASTPASSSNSSNSSSSSSSNSGSGSITGSGSTIVAFAESLQGIPYVYGGTTTAGFDCSGFTQYVYAHFGISLPRTSQAQEGAGRQIPLSQAQPGDLIIEEGGGHVAIYLGGGMQIDANHPGGSVGIRSVVGYNVNYAVHVG